jgi:hypothetical protein
VVPGATRSASIDRPGTSAQPHPSGRGEHLRDGSREHSCFHGPNQPAPADQCELTTAAQVLDVQRLDACVSGVINCAP